MSNKSESARMSEDIWLSLLHAGWIIVGQKHLCQIRSTVLLCIIYLSAKTNSIAQVLNINSIEL